MHKKLPTAAQAFLFSFKSEPGPCNPPSFSLADKDLSNVSARGPSPPDFDTLDGLGPSGTDQISEMELVPFRGRYPSPSQPTTISTFSLQSPQFPSTPCQPHRPLSLSDPDRFQVSTVTTSSELEWALCVFPPFGCRSHIVGANPIRPAVMRRCYGRDSLGFISRAPSKMLYYVGTFRTPSFINGSFTPWPRSGCNFVPVS